MAAPSFISSTNTTVATGSTSKTTASIAVTSGDVLVAHGMIENGTQSLSITTATGSTSVWTQRENNPNATDLNRSSAQSWTATATATGNITVTFTASANTLAMVGVVKVWRGSGGIGNVNLANNSTGSAAPTVSVTTTGANSGLDFCCADWSGSTGTVTFTASSGTPVTDLSDQSSSANYCVYSDHVVDAGTAAAKTMGMSAPSTQRYVCNVIEVLGSGVADVLAAQIWL